MKNQLIVKEENNSELAAEWVLLYTSLVIRILLKKNAGSCLLFCRYEEKSCMPQMFLIERCQT